MEIQKITYFNLSNYIQKKVIVFGAGYEGKLFTQCVSLANKVEVVGYLDSFGDKKFFMGKKVYSLENFPKDIDIVIASSYYENMIQQLKEIGIQKVFVIYKVPEFIARCESTLYARMAKKRCIAFYLPNASFMHHFGDLIEKVNKKENYTYLIVSPNYDVLNFYYQKAYINILLSDANSLDKNEYDFISIVCMSHVIDVPRKRRLLVLPHYNGLILSNSLLSTILNPLKVVSSKIYYATSHKDEMIFIKKYIEQNNFQNNIEFFGLGYLGIQKENLNKKQIFSKKKKVFVAPSIYNQDIFSLYNERIIVYKYICLMRFLLKNGYKVLFRPHKGWRKKSVNLVKNSLYREKNFELDTSQDYKSNLRDIDCLITDYSSIGLTFGILSRKQVFFIFHTNGINLNKNTLSQMFLKHSANLGKVLLGFDKFNIRLLKRKEKFKPYKFQRTLCGYFGFSEAEDTLVLDLDKFIEK